MSGTSYPNAKMITKKNVSAKTAANGGELRREIEKRAYLAGGSSVAGVELGHAGITEVKAAPLRSFGREMCLAWNPRLLRIRTALDKAERTFAHVFRI